MPQFPIVPGVHKMLSNLQDSELVISTSNLHVTTSTTSRTMTKNQSYLFSRGTSERNRHCRYSSINGDQSSGSVDGDDGRSSNQNGSAGASESDSDRVNGLTSDHSDNSVRVGNSDGYSAIPLGSYLHSDKGIASRTPVGRKNLGKYLQVRSILFFEFWARFCFRLSKSWAFIIKCMIRVNSG